MTLLLLKLNSLLHRESLKESQNYLQYLAEVYAIIVMSSHEVNIVSHGWGRQIRYSLEV